MQNTGHSQEFHVTPKTADKQVQQDRTSCCTECFPSQGGKLRLLYVGTVT